MSGDEDAVVVCQGDDNGDEDAVDVCQGDDNGDVRGDEDAIGLT